MHDIYRKDREGHSGRVSLFIKVFILYKDDFNTLLEVIATKVLMDGTGNLMLTVCSLYLAPNSLLSLEELNNFVLTKSQPILLLGNFNAHHCLWDSTSYDK